MSRFLNKFYAQENSQENTEKERDAAKLELVTQPTQDTQPSQPTQLTEPTQDTQPIIPNQPKIDNQPNQPKVKIRKEVSPKNDWGKTPNVTTRDILPERVFKGLSFQTYDALHLRTRRANPPVRKVRATKSDLIRWTGLSDVTLDKHLRHLKSLGLIEIEFMRGSHEGNWYEVFTADEIPNLTNPTNLTNQTNPIQPNLPKKVGGEIPNFLGGVGGVYSAENIEDNASLKTLYKTNTSDDDTFAQFCESFQNFALEIHGKKIKDLPETAKVLIGELDKRNKLSQISDIDKFLAAHLRRAFARLPKEKGSEAKKDTVGKFTGEIDSDKYLQDLHDLVELDGLESVLESLGRYDLPEDVKRELATRLKNEYAEYHKD